METVRHARGHEAQGASVRHNRLDLVHPPLAPGGAGSEQPQGGQAGEHAQQPVERLHPPAFVEGVGSHPPDEREDADGEEGLHEPGHGQVGEQHGGDGHSQGIGAVQGQPGGIMRQGGLETELHRGAEGREVERRVGGRPQAEHLRPASGGPSPHEPEQEMPREGNHEGHVESVRPEGQQPPVPEEQCLDEQRDAHGDAGRPGSQQRGDERAPHRVARGAARQRDVEHHDQEGEGRPDAQQRQPRPGDLRPGPPRRDRPDRHHRSAQHGAGGWAQVVVRNVHAPSQDWSPRGGRPFQRRVPSRVSDLRGAKHPGLAPVG